MSYATARSRRANGESNKLYLEDRPVHEWYRFVLSFPPHLVREYLHQFAVLPGMRVLDPFCGTGTTLVEAKKHGVESIGVEANPMAEFAARVKTDWRPDPERMRCFVRQIAGRTTAVLNAQGIEDEPGLFGYPASPGALRSLGRDQFGLLLTDSISPLPLHKALVLMDALDEHPEPTVQAHLRLALAKAIVFNSSNLHFGPEVGVSKPKDDAAVVAPWRSSAGAMADDLEAVKHLPQACATVHLADARDLSTLPRGETIAPMSIDAVITSPPYPNEKDYTRTTRLESVLLGFLSTKADLRALKQGLVRSNTRNVYSVDDDDRWVLQHPEIQRIAASIEARRVEMKKTSGFERLYGRVTKLYFGGMHRHLETLKPLLKPGAQLAYVVGDQASYLRIMIRTGELLASIATNLGYEHVRTDLFRTRLATATGEQLREEVVILRWPG